MDSQILSNSARILSREGFETRTGVEVAIWIDQDPCCLGDKYIRVGSSLLWEKDTVQDVTEFGNDRITCLCSGMQILL
jgi:hypothetical protein